MIVAVPLWSQRCPVCGKKLSVLKDLAIEKELLPQFFTCGHCGAKLSVSPPRCISEIPYGPIVEIDETVNRFCPVCKKWESHITYQDAEHTKSVCSHCGAKLKIMDNPLLGIPLLRKPSPTWIVDESNEEHTCPNCGHKVDKTDKFCLSCGVKLKE